MREKAEETIGIRARTALLTALSTSLVVGAVACGRSEPAATPPPELRSVGDAGTVELVAGDRRIEVPGPDVGAGKLPVVVRDEDGKRFRYATPSGELRFVYAIGDRLWVGPLVKAPPEPMPTVDRALGEVFLAAGPRRRELVADVQRSLGDRGMSLLLEGALAAPRADWDAAFPQLSPAQAQGLEEALRRRLEPRGPTSGLARAVTTLPLREVASPGALEARVRELASEGKELAPASVLLRALIALDGARAAKLGCELAARKELGASAGGEWLVEASALAVASAAAKGAALACNLAGVLADVPCMPYFRCAAGKPVTFSQTSDQSEPLCTKDEVRPVIDEELARAPAEVLAGGPRAAFFAFAALAIAGDLPEPFLQAHARRRFAVSQPKEPACDSGVASSTPCRCDEAMLRDLACRNLGASSAHVGVCKFEIDERQRKIANVRAALGL